MTPICLENVVGEQEWKAVTETYRRLIMNLGQLVAVEIIKHGQIVDIQANLRNTADLGPDLYLKAISQ